MVQELRQRSTSKKAEQSEPESSTMPIFGGGLSAESLIKSSPAQHGTVLKLHVPVIYVLSPTCFQQMLTSGWFPAFMTPQWTERHLVSLGEYLYRFKTEVSKEPKGAPTPHKMIDAKIIDEDQDLDGMEFTLKKLPSGFKYVFAVSTFSKTQYFAVSSREECVTWVNTLREAKQGAITRSMGHSEHFPYLSSWRYFDGLGSSLMKSKDRIKKKLADANRKEVEMASFSASGDIAPRGYYS